VSGRQPHPIRAALLGALAGGVAVGAVYLLIVFSDPHAFTSSSTAPIGLVFLPFYTLIQASPGALAGTAIGFLIEGSKRGRRLREPGMAVVGLIALALGSWGAATLVKGFVLGAEVRRVEGLSEPELGEALQSRLFGRNPFVLAAVAGGPWRLDGDALSSPPR
jgi:hypothetical protein